MTTWFYTLVNSSTLELISLSILTTCLLDIVQRWCLEKFHVKCFFSCMNVTQWHKSDQQIASPGRIKQRDNGNLDLNQPKDICLTSELNNKVQKCMIFKRENLTSIQINYSEKVHVWTPRSDLHVISPHDVHTLSQWWEYKHIQTSQVEVVILI